MHWTTYSVTFILAYLLGSIPTGYLMGRLKGVDIRCAGSGNIGATNALRVLGKPVGILVLFIDALKGFAACTWVPPMVMHLSPPQQRPFSITQSAAIVAGLAVVLGHLYPCWLHFKGGKGIATAGGVFSALAWKAVLITVAIWGIVLMLSRYVSMASIAAAIALPIMVWLTGGSLPLIVLNTAVSLLALYKHKGNMQRLLHGTEHRFGSPRPASVPKSTP